jgi:hypothetical protein
MPYKDFTAGQVVPAQEVNTYLMNQSVIVFDDSTQRNATITTPVQGMSTYLKNTKTLETYDGTNWIVTQPVMIYDSATARTSSLTTPVEGMTTYLKDTDSMFVYDGTNWLQTGVLSRYDASIATINSTTYTNNGNTTPSLTLVTGTKTLLTISLNTGGTTSGAFLYISYTVSGATTIAGDDTRSIIFTNPAGGAGQRYRVHAQFPITTNRGSNTFQIVGRSNTGSCVLENVFFSVQNVL